MAREYILSLWATFRVKIYYSSVSILIWRNPPRLAGSLFEGVHIICRVNDRIISANGISLEGADYGAAVRVLRDSGSTVLLVVKRRASSSSPGCLGSGVPQSHRLTLTRNNKKDGT